MRIIDEPKRVETTLIVKVAMEFYDADCDEETVRACVSDYITRSNPNVEIIDISLKK